MKPLLAIALVLLLPAGLFAQWEFGVSGQALLPISPASYSDDYGLVFGGQLHGRYALKHNLRLGLNLAYWEHGFEGVAPTDPDTAAPQLGLIPVSLAGEYTLLFSRVQVYGGLELGYCLIRETQDRAGRRDALGTSGAFFAAPVVGLRYALTDGLHLDARLSYSLVFTSANATSQAFAQGGSAQLIGLSAGVVYRLRPGNYPRK